MAKSHGVNLLQLLTSHKGSMVAALLAHQILACSLIRILMSKVSIKLQMFSLNWI